MKKLLITLVGLSLTAGWIGNAFAGAKEEIKEDTQTLKNFTSPSSAKIPPAVLEKAKGFAIFHIVDVALLVNGKGGPGIVVARTGQGWSGPLFVGLGGAGVGAQIGGKVNNIVMVLNTDKAIESISHGNVKLGVDVSAAAGPAHVDATQQAMFTNKDILVYKQSEGVFAGGSVEGSVIAPRGDTNNSFYGKKVTPSEILQGKVQAPAAANRLEKALANAGKGMASNPTP